MEPVRDRIYFAGEAVHETQWGTVGGAWESGEQRRRGDPAQARRAEGAGRAQAAPEKPPRRSRGKA